MFDLIADGVELGHGGFERGGQRIGRGLVGPRHALGRHLSAVQLADDFFPSLRVGGDVLEVRRIQHKLTHLEPGVVTPHAIGRQQGAIRIGLHCRARAGLGREPEQQRIAEGIGCAGNDGLRSLCRRLHHQIGRAHV